MTNNDVIGPIIEPYSVTPGSGSVQRGSSEQITVVLNRSTSAPVTFVLTYSAVDSQGQPVSTPSVLSSPPPSITISSGSSGSVTVNTLSTSPAVTVTVTAIGGQNPTGAFDVTT
jgi:flavin reductase (DIM6/NTAB) family NADH-FMN oxidoreductase RutF